MQEVLIVGGREVAVAYSDPVDMIWVEVARRLGMRVVRRSDVYAAWDGRGTLALGTPETLDADDCLAQLILHEIAHWVTRGEASFYQVDWGFEPSVHVHWLEYPTVRLQGWLAQAHGLRGVLAPTTNSRVYYDSLVDLLAPADDSDLEARVAAHTRLVVERVQGAPWWQPLQDGLVATAAVYRAVSSFAPDVGPGSMWGSEARVRAGSIK